MPKRIVTNIKRKEVAVEKLTALSDGRKQAEEVAERKRHTMFAGMLKAYDAGMTYEEIAEVTGLSKIRVSQVLSEQRGMAAPPAKTTARKPAAKKTAPAKRAAAKKAPARKTAARKKAA